jgi:hypothetical protein
VRRAAVALALALPAVAGAAACDRRGNEAAQGAASCPPCECVCDCDGSTPAAAKDTAGVGAGSAIGVGADIADLVASATRKMNHGDGAGCLADLDAVAGSDPKMDERLAVTRGQCEMLVGECQKGKERVAKWYEVETAMTPERAEITAEQLGSMRCRGGDASDRDQLLVAFFNLSDGAYMNTRESKFCQDNVDLAKKLIPRVKPTGPDDTQVSGGAQALFHTAASCFARAGDCTGAFDVYAELFPSAGLSAISDPAQREKIIRDSFDSSIVRCSKTPP